MDRLGIIPTSSATGTCLLWWLSDKHTNYLPEALPMRTSGLFIGKRPLFLRICPLFSGKCPLLLRKCPLCLLKHTTLRARFLRQTRLCMVGDNNRVIKCKRHRSVTLSRARVRVYSQEFNDFCCHICHMCILNCYVSVKYSNLWHVLTKRQSESCFFFLGDSQTWAFSCSFNRFAALFYRFCCAVLPLSLLDFAVFAASIFLHRIRCVTDVTAKKYNLLVYTRARSIDACMSRRVRKRIPDMSVISYWRVWPLSPKCRAHWSDSSVIRVWIQKMGYHCIPTLLTLNLILWKTRCKDRFFVRKLQVWVCLFCEQKAFLFIFPTFCGVKKKNRTMCCAIFLV